MKPGMKSPAELLTPGRALTLANVAEGAEGLIISDLARAIAARPKKPTARGCSSSNAPCNSSRPICRC
jgi:hypothetical protein